MQWQRLVETFLDALAAERGLAKNTVDAYRRDLERLGRDLDEHGEDLASAKAPELQRHLRDLRRRGIAPRSVRRAVAAIRGFYAYLVQEGMRRDNPAVHLVTPKTQKPLPKVLTEREVGALLEMPDLSKPLGMRDKSMLELLYATGLRVSELVGLTLTQLRLDAGFLIAFGKGSKERIVPVGERAELWTRRYLAEARPLVARGRHELVYVNCYGLALSRHGFWKNLRAYGRSVGIKALSPHVLRHSFATHLLEAGVDLATIQSLMGHNDINTTMRYLKIRRHRFDPGPDPLDLLALPPQTPGQ